MDDNKAKARKLPVPGPKKHRLLKAVVVLSLVAVGLVAALPWLLGTPPARALILAQVNARLAPGSLELTGLGLSWSGPIALDGVSLRDPKGKVVLAASRVILDRGLVRLITSRPDYGIVTVEGATVDLERRADGSIDLLDALASLTGPAAPAKTPKVVAPAPASSPSPSPMAVTVRIRGGTLKVASPELVEPFEAGTVEGSLTIAPGKPIELEANLGGEGRSLEIRSTLDQDPAADRSLSVVAKDWPIHVRRSGVETRGRLAGTLEAKQAGGSWSVVGDTALEGFEAAGPALQGDKLALDRVTAACEIAQSATGWTIRKLDLASPVASLQGSGTFPAVEGTPSQVRGKVDLASLAKALPNAMRLRDGLTLDRGSATIRVDVTTAAGSDRLELVASLDDFAATEGGRPVRLRKPVFVTGRAARAGGKVTVETLELKAAGIDVTAGGDLEAGAKLSGTVDLVAFTAQLRDVLDLGKIDLAGQARMAADYRHTGDSYKGRLAAEFNGLKVVGLTSEPIVRDLVRLDGSATGPAKSDGIPSDWQQARLDVKAGDLKLDLQATSTGPDANLVAGFEMMVASPVPGRLDARAKFRKKGSLLDVDELTAGITPTDPAAASGVVALAVRGQFDSSQGQGAFGPIPGYPVGAVGLGPEGAKLSGVGQSGVPLKVDAALVGDLASLDRLLASWSGAPLKGLRGLWATQLVVARSAAGKLDLEAKTYVPNLTFSTPKGPVSLTAKAAYFPDLDQFDLTALDLATDFGRVDLAVHMHELKGRKLMELTGTVEPNWAALDPILTASAGEHVKVRATVRPIHLAGSLQADSTWQRLGQLTGEVALDLTEVDAFGVKLAPTPVVLKMGAGLAKFDPIVTTMNDGPVSIVADLALDGDFGLWMRVGSSKVDGAAINEEVSNTLLAYVAPVMAKSSQVSGKVTVVVDRAFVPITAKGALALDGAMAMQNVVFQPGPLATELNSLTGQAMHVVKLDEAMFLKIADGRVIQNGLSIPVGGNGLKVAIDGSVGFDKTLDLKATIPLTAKALGLESIADKSAGGATVALPIRGTLSRPAIDRNALRVALRDAAKAVGEKRLKSEAGRLLERIAGPANQADGEARPKSGARNPLGDLESLGREILDPKKP